MVAKFACYFVVLYKISYMVHINKHVFLSRRDPMRGLIVDLYIGTSSCIPSNCKHSNNRFKMKLWTHLELIHISCLTWSKRSPWCALSMGSRGEMVFYSIFQVTLQMKALILLFNIHDVNSRTITRTLALKPMTTNLKINWKVFHWH